jgi:hypothetical protein
VSAAVWVLAASLLPAATAQAPASDPSCPLSVGSSRASTAGCAPSAGPGRAVAELREAPAAPAADPPAVVQPAPAPGYDTDLDTDPSEPDFTVVDLPTNARLPRHRLGFRLTHRFARPLGEGDFSDLASDLFGFDGGAQIGLGLRFGLFRGTQLGVYRTSDRTILLHGQQELLHEGRSPIGASLVAGVEGLNNFGLSEAPSPAPRHEFSPSIGFLLSRRLGSHGAVYVQPQWVGNTRVTPSAPGEDDGSLVLGLGARLRVTKSMSLVGETYPRLAGYAGDLGSGDSAALVTFGVEWTVGGHAFQLNFSNALGTTPAQVARGAQGQDGWFIGFNLSRKFY